MGLLEDYFSGGGNLNNGQRRDGDATLRELLNQSAFATSGRVIYAVADPVESELEADGSRGRPFGPSQLQDAIDAAEALSPTAANPVTVFLGPGIFDIGSSSLEVHEDGIMIIGSGRFVTTILSTATVLTVTNASKSSLALFRISGTYSDLVYSPGDPVPIMFLLNNLTMQSTSVSSAVIELFGVKGDASPTTTNFGYSIVNALTISSVEIKGGVNPMVHAKNVGILKYWHCVSSWKTYFDNCYTIEINDSAVLNPVVDYDAASADGRHAEGHWAVVLRSNYCWDIEANGASMVQLYDCFGMDDIVANNTAGVTAKNTCFDDISVNDTAVVTLTNGSVDQVNGEGGATFTGNGLHIGGNLVLDAGTGVVTLNGGEFMGTNAGAGAARLVRNHGDPSGVKFTPEKGLAIKLTNKTGAASVKGTLVSADTTTDGAFKVTPANDPQPFGIVYESGVADGSECWVIVYGIAQILLEDASASTRGYWVRTSITQAGRVDITNAAPPGGGVVELDVHMQEVGHCIESQGAGTNVLALCVVHFN